MRECVFPWRLAPGVVGSHSWRLVTVAGITRSRNRARRVRYNIGACRIARRPRSHAISLIVRVC